MLLALLIAAGSSAPDPAVALIREVTADVEELRGLRRKVNLKVELLDGPLFSEAVRKKALEDLTPAYVAQEQARWTAFNLAPQGSDPGRILLDVLDEQVAGFYDPKEKKLFVLQGSSPDLLRVVLAHEIEHALQDQNFGIPDFASLPDDDARAARSALLEGDAMAVMAAYTAQRLGRSVPNAIAQTAETLRNAGPSLLSANMAKLRAAPAIVREELLFPYSAGLSMVAEAYQRGGWLEVNKLFANPPASSHQVLHGEPSLPVPLPANPPGTKLLAQGRMGELGARVAFEACLEKPAVEDVIANLAGDAYSVYERHGHLELLWASAWAGSSAQSAANLLRLIAPCWQEQRGVAQQMQIDKRGVMVAVVRGEGNLAPLLAQVSLPAAGPRASEGSNRFDGRNFTSARLGLSGTMPEGFQERETRDELSMESFGSSATLAFVPRKLDDDGIEKLAQQYFPDAQLAYAGNADKVLAGQPARERSFSIEGATVRIDAISWCGGRATVAIVRREKDGTNLGNLLPTLKPMGAPLDCAKLE